jgi:hypothetical protein
MIELLYFLHDVAVRCTIQRFIAKAAKSEKPAFHKESPSLKNRSFLTGHFKILKTVGDLSLDLNY